MNREQIIDVVAQFSVDEFEVNVDGISPDANLKETLDLDSLDFVDLVVLIESHFGFKVNAEDFVGIKTFDDFYNYIEGYTKK